MKRLHALFLTVVSGIGSKIVMRRVLSVLLLSMLTCPLLFISAYADDYPFLDEMSLDELLSLQTQVNNKIAEKVRVPDSVGAVGIGVVSIVDDVYVTVKEAELHSGENVYNGQYGQTIPFLSKKYIDSGTMLCTVVEFVNRSKKSVYLHPDTIKVVYGDGYVFDIDFDHHTQCCDTWMYSQKPLTTETHYWAIPLPDEVVNGSDPITMHINIKLKDSSGITRASDEEITLRIR